jgi:hypothetical protein
VIESEKGSTSLQSEQAETTIESQSTTEKSLLEAVTQQNTGVTEIENGSTTLQPEETATKQIISVVGTQQDQSSTIAPSTQQPTLEVSTTLEGVTSLNAENTTTIPEIVCFHQTIIRKDIQNYYKRTLLSLIIEILL